tara:strand:- start:880 stop:1548 length:669 start_codon:yes stop_codon:yes gene_type:complete
MKRARSYQTRNASSVNEITIQPLQDRPNGMFDMLPDDAIKKIYEAVERARPCVGHTVSLVWTLIKCWPVGLRVFSVEFRRLNFISPLLQNLQYEKLQQIVEANPFLIAFPMDPTGDRIFSAKIQEGELQLEKFKNLAKYCTQELALVMNFRVESELFENGTWRDVDLGADREGHLETPNDENDERAEQEVVNPKMTFVICTEVDYTGGNLHQLNHHFQTALN